MQKNKKKKISKDEIRAYWIGVGISVANHKESNKLLDSSNSRIRRSVRKGYQADNHDDISKRFM